MNVFKIADVSGRYNISDTEAKRIADTVETEDDFSEIWENLDWWADENNVAELNKNFETALLDACKEHLREGLQSMVKLYVFATLDEMWNGETYVSEGGTPLYHEIPARQTKTGNPYVVS